jgi:predicted CXXCH cytochrome family protein
MERTSNDCGTCHKPASFKNKRVLKRLEPTKLQRDMTNPGHAECAQCHHKSQKGGFFVRPEVTKDCESCHATAPEDVEKSHFVANSDYRVTYSFKLQKKKVGRSTLVASDWHSKHAKASRDKKKGKDCMQCHEGAESEAGFLVPLPSKQACESCHNGEKAFGVLGTECSRCHTPRPVKP